MHLRIHDLREHGLRLLCATRWCSSGPSKNGLIFIGGKNAYRVHLDERSAALTRGDWRRCSSMVGRNGEALRLALSQKKTPNIRCPTTLESTTVAQTSSRYKHAHAVLSGNSSISCAACVLTMRHDDLAMISARYAAVTVGLLGTVIIPSEEPMLDF